MSDKAQTAATGPDIAFQRHLAEGQFMIQRGVDSGTYFYFQRALAPVTGEELEWVPASGLGTVHSTTCLRKRPPEPALNIALIDLDEGPRMMSRVEGIDAHDVTIGMRVRASIVPSDGEDKAFIVIFHPLEAGQ